METFFLADAFARVHEDPMTHRFHHPLRIGCDGDVVELLVDGRPRSFARGPTEDAARVAVPVHRLQYYACWELDPECQIER